jgi:excisionase family DNA binding protein
VVLSVPRSAFVNVFHSKSDSQRSNCDNPLEGTSLELNAGCGGDIQQLMSDLQIKQLADALNALAFTISDMINDRLVALTAARSDQFFRTETERLTMSGRTSKSNATEGYLIKSEAARILHVTPRSIDNWMGRGLLPYFKIGRSVRFRMSDVQSFLDARCRIGGSPTHSGW